MTELARQAGKIRPLGEPAAYLEQDYDFILAEEVVSDVKRMASWINNCCKIAHPHSRSANRKQLRHGPFSHNKFNSDQRITHP